MEFDPRLHAPFCMVISGPTKSGKSTLVKELIERRQEIIYPAPERVIYHFGADQPKLFQNLKETVPMIEFNKGMPTEFGDELCTPTLVIIDDLMEECLKSTDLLNVFIRGSHHYNVSVIFISQLFYHPGLRPLTLNASYVCLFKNPRDTNSVSILGRQMNCNKQNHYMDQAYKCCMQKPHGYIFIDLTQDANDDMRLRDSVFPDIGTTVFVKE